MINYENAINIIISIATITFAFALLFSWYYITYFILAGRKDETMPHSNKKTKFAVLIAARNESKVIRKLLDSLKNQTYDKDFFDVWVIVESFDDPTIEILKEYNYHYFVRDKLDDTRRTKGFALQECINHFKKEQLIYDAYMIFDADNILEPRYIEAMNDLRQTGVKVGLGYRNFTNASENWLTCCSATMFAYMNQITSKGRSILFHKVTLMGTGYYVDSSIINDLGGWIFTGMTEDIQLTSYCYYHDIYMRYYPNVQFFDEQSPKMKDVHNQHIRWLYGYMAGRSFLKRNGVSYNYHSDTFQKLMRLEFKLGVVPFVVFNVINILLFLASLALSIASSVFNQGYFAYCFGLTMYQFILMYMTFVVAASITIGFDNKHLKFNFATKCWAILTYMFFFYDFAFAFFDGLFHKEKRTTWKKINHSGNVTSKDIETKVEINGKQE